MALRRFTLLILFALCSALASAQSQLAFSPAEWDFGTIREADGPVSHTFTGENTGRQPLVILDVVTSCGCTVPEFSRQPILPGAKVSVGVRFDPANRPGTFSKELSVYSTERRKVAVLRIRGTVLPRERSVEERYPLDAGSGIRLNTGLCAFAYVYQGRRVESTVSIVNTAPKSVTLELVPEERSGLLSVEAPQRLAPGEEGVITLAYTIPSAQPRYGTLRDVLGIRIDGRTSRIPLVVHGIGVDLPQKYAPGKTGPRAQLEKNTLKFDGRSCLRTEATPRSWCAASSRSRASPGSSAPESASPRARASARRSPSTPPERITAYGWATSCSSPTTPCGRCASCA